MSLRVHQSIQDYSERWRQSQLDDQRRVNRSLNDQQQLRELMVRKSNETHNTVIGKLTHQNHNYSSISSGGTYSVSLTANCDTGNPLTDWIFEVPQGSLDAIALPFKWFGVCMTAYTILFPTMFCVASGTTWSKMDKGVIWMLLRLTAFFWSVYGVTRGTQKIVQLFEKHRQRAKASPLPE